MRFEFSRDSELASITCKATGLKIPETGRELQDYDITVVSRTFKDDDVKLKKSPSEDLISFIGNTFVGIKWSPFVKAHGHKLSAYIEEALNNGFYLNVIKGGKLRLINAEKEYVGVFTTKQFEEMLIERLKKQVTNPEKIDEVIRMYEEVEKEKESL